MRAVIWVDTSKQDLMAFPATAKQRMGYQIHRVQSGQQPTSWKPVTSIAAGVQEIRVSDETGVYRSMYVAKSGEAVYVLHCFPKKTRRTSKSDIAIAKARYAEVLRLHKRKI